MRVLPVPFFPRRRRLNFLQLRVPSLSFMLWPVYILYLDTYLSRKTWQARPWEGHYKSSLIAGKSSRFSRKGKDKTLIVTGLGCLYTTAFRRMGVTRAKLLARVRSHESVNKHSMVSLTVRESLARLSLWGSVAGLAIVCCSHLREWRKERKAEVKQGTYYCLYWRNDCRWNPTEKESSRRNTTESHLQSIGENSSLLAGGRCLCIHPWETASSIRLLHASMDKTCSCYFHLTLYINPLFNSPAPLTPGLGCAPCIIHSLASSLIKYPDLMWTHQETLHTHQKKDRFFWGAWGKRKNQPQCVANSRTHPNPSLIREGVISTNIWDIPTKPRTKDRSWYRTM